jgi:hypothetical protein
LVIIIESGVVDLPVEPNPIGFAVAVISKFPRREGFHEQVATMFGVDPVVGLLTQPGNRTPFA